MQPHAHAAAYLCCLNMLIAELTPVELLGGTRLRHEDISFEHLSVDQGLSNPNVRAIVQDHYGFMWFGTEDGLNRYDGYSFTVYKHNPADSCSLSSNYIQCLLEDDEGVLWIGTGGGGLNSLDLKTGKLKRHGLNGQYVYAIHAGKDGELWVGANGLNAFARRAGELFPVSNAFTVLSSLEGTVVRAIHEDENGVLWIGTWFAGIQKIDKDRRRIFAFRHDPLRASSLPENHVISVFKDSHGDYWFGTYTAGLTRLEVHTGTFETFSHDHERRPKLNDNTIRTIYEDGRDRLWLGTAGGGVNVLDRKAREVTYLTHSNSNPASLLGAHVYAICADEGGTLWFGTDGGVSKYSPLRRKFSFMPGSAGIFPDPLGVMCEDQDGALWIGGNRGVMRYQRKGQEEQYYSSVPESSRALRGRYVSSIHADRLGYVWFGTIGDGLWRYDRRTGMFKPYTIMSSDSSRNGNSAAAFYEDSEGTLWFSAGRGIASLDRKNDRLTYYGDHATIQRRDLAVVDVQCIQEERKGILLLGTKYAGLIEFDPQQGVLSHFKHDDRDPGSLGSNDVRFLHRDNAGRLWLGTHGGGIELYDRVSRTFSRITERDGLISNVISGILEDDSGDLWISTPKGLSRFNPETRRIQNYEAADGITGLVGGSCAKSRTGELMFGSTHGLFVFRPEDVKDNLHIPNVVLTAFNVFNEPYALPQPLQSTAEITLDYTQNFFSFEFASLDYTAPDRNHYAFKLEGVDNNWVNVGVRHRANYTNIDPGSYVFRVKGSNNDGLWNEKGTSISLVITPPFWQTWWFRVPSLLVIAVLLALGYNYRVNKLLEVERLRLRIARDLHDELGSNLSGIALASDMLRDGRNLTADQRLRLSEISSNAMRTADAMREIVWFIYPDHDQKGDLVLMMKDVATSILEKAELAFVADEDAFGTSSDLDFRRNVFLIYKEILNNIARHARCSRVEVRLSRDGAVFRMSVADNGAGFDPQCVQQGNGLNNIKARAAAIGGRIDIASAPACGTRISLLAKMA